jgi:hypothetical protein
MNIYEDYGTEGRFIEAPYINGLDEGGLRQRNNSNVKHAVMKRIGSNDGPLYTVKLDDEFDHDVELKSSIYSKTYRVFAGYFTFCKEAVFGRPGLTQAVRDLNDSFEVGDEYVPGTRQSVRNEYNDDCNFDIKAVDPTCYEGISRYVYSVYERIVWFFYEIFGIDD